jgi:uncharacterized membrane protein YcaP (DUF421 family)
VFFSSWMGLARVLIVGVLAYAVLVLWLRIAGKRTLSKWNAFDFVVTIALGSTLATALLSKQVVLIEGVVAFALLIALQYVITWLSVRSPTVRRLIKAEPTLLMTQGQFLPQAMKSQRVTESEVRAAVRSAGLAALQDVYAVVLETDGSFSVIKQTEADSSSALADVANIEALNKE